MGLGMTGESDRIRLRNRLGYTLRSAVLAMNRVRIREVGRAVGSIWVAFLVQLGGSVQLGGVGALVYFGLFIISEVAFAVFFTGLIIIYIT